MEQRFIPIKERAHGIKHDRQNSGHRPRYRYYARELMEVLMSYIGLLDIFVMVDSSSVDVKNKKTVKERSVKFASNEYK